VLVFAALVAPESRRNGTTQYLLSTPVSRAKVACAQFAALALLVVLATGIVHGVFCWTARGIGAISTGQAVWSWIFLLGPVLAGAAVVFVMSLRFSAIRTIVLMLAVPLVVGTVPRLFEGFARWDITRVVKVIERVAVFYPVHLDELVLWPELPADAARTAPLRPEWGWMLLHEGAAAAFWLVAGAWLYARHDLGSRTALE
jgi:hypothetical protein